MTRRFGQASARPTLALVAAIALGACGSTSPRATAAKPHVFVIVMENKSFAQAMTGRYTASLAKKYAVATSYYAIGYPSVPNHLALTSGSTWGIRDDGYRPLNGQNLGSQLTKAAIPWRAYFEGFTGDCFASPYPYVVRHNPFAYYGGACPSNVAPLSRLDVDLSGNTPNLVWIVPDLCHSTHDCPVRTGDAWLQSVVPRILKSPAWQRDGVLYITWDEDAHAADNRVATLVIAPHVAKHESDIAHNHYSLLAAVEDLLGISRLGHAATAKPLTEFLPH